ncbi:MAG TPA: hypothetical protein VL728_05815 [Cyclobacteriaceae bacterium]|jgi:hypothetical protein|nr:hypothetical protein [Cyclobacteriaceae bacterium]
MRAGKIIIPLFFFSMAAFAKSSPDTVKVGVYIISIHDINFHDKEYTARFWLWFTYDYNKELDFSKELDIPNAKDIQIDQALSDTINGKIWVQLKMKCTMKEDWQVHDFPFDKQHLKINIEDSNRDVTSLIFVADNEDSRLNANEGISGWVMTKFSVKASRNPYDTPFGDPRPEVKGQTYSAINVSIDIEREAGGLFLKIFLGMYFAFLIAMVSFLSDTNEVEPRFGLPVGGLFAAVGNKYIIDSVLPESSQFSLVDILHSLTFFGIFTILIVSATALKLHNNNKVEQAHKLNLVGAIVVIVGYLAANIYYVLSA